MKKRLIYLLLLLPVFLQAQILAPIHWSARTEQHTDSTVLVLLTATIDEGWHLYTQDIPDGGPVATTFTYAQTAIGSTTTEAVVLRDYDPNFEMELTYYSGNVEFRQEVLAAPGDTLSGSVTFMACNDQQCLAPDTWEWTVNSPPKIGGVAEGRGSGLASSSSQSLLWIFLMGLIAGLLAVFTPCVWPIIPMTVSFFMKNRTSGIPPFTQALLYGISIVIIYVGLGLLVTVIFGASALNALSTNAVLNLIFFAVLVLFAASFFGAFEFTLPSSWSTKMDEKRSTTTGFLSILFMAFTLVIVSFSCTGPIIGTLLVEAAGKSLLAPTIGMLGFALALALPFTLFALFPNVLKRLPKSGGWMNHFKVTLAFLELALSLKFFSVADMAYGWHLLERPTFIALWIVIFGLLGLYLLGLISFPHDDEAHRTTSVPRFFLAVITLAFTVYLIPGMFGAPVTAISAFAPPASYSTNGEVEKGMEEVQIGSEEVQNGSEGLSYYSALAYAKEHNMPVFLDFNGYGCVNCRKMEAAVFARPEVKERLANYVFVSLIVDDKTKLSEPETVIENGRERTLKTVGDKWSYLQRSVYGANAQPFYIQLNPDGEIISDSYSYNEDVEAFLRWLKY